MKHACFVVMTIITLSLALPRDDDDARYPPLAAEVHHPDGFLYVEVVEDGAAVESLVEVSVYGPARVPMHPPVPDVTFEVTLVVDPRLLPEGDVLD